VQRVGSLRHSDCAAPRRLPFREEES
jgi:hypothetical protein